MSARDGAGALRSSAAPYYTPSVSRGRGVAFDAAKTCRVEVRMVPVNESSAGRAAAGVA